MKTSADLLYEHVIRLVEPLTRFDRSSLVREVELISEAQGQASWWFFPTFDIDKSESAGPLPSGVRSFPSAGAANEAATSARDAAKRMLEGRLERWARENADDESALTVSDCFDGPFEFGAQSTCGGCNGNGKNRCGACGGQGRNRCSSCGGSGSANCRSCGGSGNQSCGSCGGMGRQQHYVTKSVWDGYANRYVSKSETEYRNCSMCMGRGRQTCFTCSGSRTVRCWGCGASGYVNCGGCGATGQVTCSSCQGTGQRHQRWRLSCKVSNRVEVKIQHDTSEVVAKLHSLSLDGLRDIAIVRQVEPKVFDDVVGRRYAVSCRVTQMAIEIGERIVTLAAYGGSAKVFDFKNIVGVLLEGDLAELEQAVDQSSAVSLRPQAPLVEAVTQCLLSEANAQLGEGGEAAKRLQAMGGLSGDYAERLTRALRLALARLYFGEIVLGAAIAAVLPAVSLLTAVRLGLVTDYNLQALTLSVLGGVAAFALMELMARKKLGESFGAVFGKDKIVGILKAQKVFRLWRIGAAAAATALTLLAMRMIEF